MAEQAKRASNVQVRIQSGTERTCYATWTWDVSNTDSYDVMWTYYTSSSDNVWFLGSETNEKYKQSVYSPPDNAIGVRFKVKPKAKDKGDKKKTPYWNAEWSTVVTFMLPSTVRVEVPDVPEVTVNAFQLTAQLDCYDPGTVGIEFEVVKNDASVYKSGKATLVTNHAAWTCTVDAGSRYKVRARAYATTNFYSNWSEYSENVTTKPGTVPKINSLTTVKVDETIYVKLVWSAITNVTSYDIQYTTQKEFFDVNPSAVTTVEQDVEQGTTLYVGTVGGENATFDYTTYYFRIRGKNDVDDGGWSAISSIKIAAKPGVPTTWMYTSVVEVGQGAYLNWVHNSSDGSEQTAAQVEEWVNGGSQTTTRNITGTQSTYIQSTGTYPDGTYVTWRVRTKGSGPEWSDWSVVRRVDIVQPPTLTLGVYDDFKWKWDTFNFITDNIYMTDGDYGNLTHRVTKYPFFAHGIAGPASQVPISYSIDILANEPYEETNYDGTGIRVSAGESIFSCYISANNAYYDTRPKYKADDLEVLGLNDYPSDNYTPMERRAAYMKRGNELCIALLPGDVNFQNNINYTLHVTVAMSSGLTAEVDYDFYIAWEEEEFLPDAYVFVDKDNLYANIQPFCTDAEGNSIYDVIFSVYRREYDGRFRLIEDNIPGPSQTTVTDPHPALDYARYRIVAMSMNTGSISYFDIPPEEIGDGNIVIQWDEDWVPYDGGVDNEPDTSSWRGSMLKLPYNVDVQADQTPDVALVNYIGRENPVSYYGTQKGETSRWSCDVPKDDVETIYGIRRLAAYSGDVYVREPSGIGYWANITVSYTMTHHKPVVPVSFTISRVEGGV